jgi:hypothetical protein
MAKFYRCFIIKKFIYYGYNHQSHEKDKTIFVDLKMSGILGIDKVKIYKTTYYYIS